MNPDRSSAPAQAGRAVARLFGGRALKGSARQKEWAEQIRAAKLAQMTEEQARWACDPNGLLTGAQFWIEHRETSGAVIGAFVAEQKRLLKFAQMLREENRANEYAAVAAQYNALTTTWGFK